MRTSISPVIRDTILTAMSSTRQDSSSTSRVPADAEFDFSVTLKILDVGEEELLDYLLLGLKLLEMDALGGSGSRGYGRVKFIFDGELAQRFAKVVPFPNQNGG